MAFEEVCPERIDLIHKNYRKLCNLLIDVEEWGQVVIINMLTRYARTQFLNPNMNVSENTGVSGVRAGKLIRREPRITSGGASVETLIYLHLLLASLLLLQLFECLKLHELHVVSAVALRAFYIVGFIFPLLPM